MEITQKNKTKYFAGLMLFVAVIFFLASWYVHEKQLEYVSAIKLNISEQEKRMIRLAELSDRDGVDAVVNELVQDCDIEERARFDDLLGRLSQLSRSELSETDQLFNSCGGYFAERKAVLVSRLQREFEVYRDYVTLITLVDDRIDTLSPKQDMWGELVSHEKERSNLSKKLVDIQDDIITALLNNVSIQSDEMQSMLKEAQDAKDYLSYLDKTIDPLRQDVIGI